MLVFHIDMDAFFASIEQHDRPELRGLPIIIGSDSRRGVVATASYEARKFGVHSAQPMAIAKQKCPEGIIVYPRFERYSQVSKQIMAIFEEFSPTIEPLSIDEAFLDMTGTQAMGTPLELAIALQRRIFEVTGLTCSIGIAHNKFLAKLSSDLKKPNGITMVPDGQEKDFIAPLPVRKLWGVGPKSEAKIRELGIETIGDVAEADLTRLREQLGRSMADHIYALAHAIDHRQISPDRERKSIGSETTFDVDIRTQDQVALALRPHADDVARTLRKKNLKAQGVRVKVRYTRGFVLQSRQKVIVATDDADTLWHAACQLLTGLKFGEPIRLVGLTGYDLVEASDAPEQLGLFGAPAVAKAERTDLNRTLDAISDKFGAAGIQRGSSLKPNS